MDAQRLLDHIVHVGQLLDGVIIRHTGGDVGVELGLQFGEDARGAEHPVEEGAGGVAGGVGAGDELGEGLGGEF